MVLFKNITVVTMDDEAGVIENGFVTTKGGRIEYVGTEEPAGQFETVIDGRGKVLMPGLINTHSHLAMTLLRGYADDMNLQDWLYNKISPLRIS